MRGLPDNNADGAEGTIPYIYLDFCKFFGGGSGCGVESFDVCIVYCTVSSRGIK